MPYLPLDLDAKRKLEAIERGLALPRHTMVGGTMEVWETVWRQRDGQEPDLVDELTLAAAFGPDVRVRDAMVSRGFLEPSGGRWRVRGASKWLFGLEGKSRGGKAASGNLRRGNKAGESAGGAESPSPGVPGPMPEDTPRLEARLLHPASSIQHPASKKEETPLTRANAISAMGGTPAPPAITAGAQPDRRQEPRVEFDPAATTLQEAMEKLWEKHRGTAPTWGRDFEHKVRPAFSKANGSQQELLRVFEAALKRDRYPVLANLSELARHWDAYAATKGPEPGRKGGPHARATEADRVQPGYEPKLDANGDLDLGSAA